MGQGLSCAGKRRGGNSLFSAVRNGDISEVAAMVAAEPAVLSHTTGHGDLSVLHVAAATGQIQILSMVLDRSVNPDVLNRHKQTPLMVAAMHGNISCLERLIQAGANILMFDAFRGRTCLHYAASYGHPDCLQSVLSAAHSSPVANSWGFARFVNIRDKNGATPLHLAAQKGQPECIHILLNSGALVCSSTGGYGYRGSTPLHLAARVGSLDCVRELLSWGADRLLRDSSGRIPHMVALKYKHEICAALLNPSAPEPLIWPSPFKFIAELNPEAKALLERALMETNKEREKAILKETVYSLPSPPHEGMGANGDMSEASDVELCCICFDQACTIEVQTCGHQMCANCTLALCCQNKPNPATPAPKAPVCPFCRSNITQLVVAEIKTKDADSEYSPSKPRLPRKSLNICEGSSSCKGLSVMGSFGKLGGRVSGKVASDCDDEVDKP